MVIPILITISFCDYKDLTFWKLYKCVYLLFIEINEVLITEQFFILTSSSLSLTYYNLNLIIVFLNKTVNCFLQNQQQNHLYFYSFLHENNILWPGFGWNMMSCIISNTFHKYSNIITTLNLSTFYRQNFDLNLIPGYSR